MRNALFMEISDKLRKRISEESERRQGDWTLPTLNEIAKEYRVSLVTAKKAVDVLTGEGLTSARPGVGITVNSAAMKDRRKTLGSFEIGVVFTDIFEVNEGVIGDIVKGAAETQSAFGFNLKLISLPSAEPVERQIDVLKGALAKGLDGLMIASRAPLRLLAFLQERKTPMVLLNESVRHEPIPAVLFDRTQMFLEVVDRLKEIGAKDVAFVAPSASIEDGRLFDGLCQGAGISRRRILAHGSLTGLSEAQATAKADVLTDFKNASRPDAIVCGGEMATFGALQALAAMNMKVPQDVHVVSVMERAGLQAKLTVPVDVIVHSFSGLAKEGAAMLHEILSGRPPEPHIRYVRAELLRGERNEP